MESNSIQKEVLGCEKKYWDAMKTNDVETAVSLTKFPCTVAGSNGIQKINEAEYRKMMNSQKENAYQGVEMQNPQVDILGKDTAVCTYTIDLNGKKMLDVSTWVRENGKWACGFHSENQLQ